MLGRGSSRRAVASGPYSPNYVEGVGELPLYGVLRSSASGRGTSKRKEGYVILLLPALPYEGVELLQEEVP
jgi:hypothetical protein